MLATERMSIDACFGVQHQSGLDEISFGGETGLKSGTGLGVDIRGDVNGLTLAPKGYIDIDPETYRSLRRVASSMPSYRFTDKPSFDNLLAGCAMLVLSRKRDEKIVIGDSIKLTVIEIRGDIVRLGIEAPRDVTVHREEIYDAIQKKLKEEEGQ